jgi:hypothetical protein
VRRRRLLAAAASAVATVGLVGCLDGTADDTESASRAPGSGVGTTASETTRSTGTTADVTPDETTVPVDAPDPDHDVWVQNHDDTTHRMTVTVTRLDDGDTGEVVHESTHEQDPYGSDLAYNLRESDPDGVERFEVAGETGDQRASRYIATSECYTDCHVVVREDGELVVRRPIC